MDMNSARSLLALLQEWEIKPNQTAAAVRGDGNYQGLSFWAEHRKALDWLQDIESALNALAGSKVDVSIYWESVPYWYAALFALRPGLQTAKAQPDELIQPEHLNMLQALAGMLDVVDWEPKFVEDQANVFEALVHAEDLIRTDELLSDSTRRYLLQLLNEVKFHLSHAGEYGSAAARKSTMQFTGALVTVAATTDSKARGTEYMKISVEIARAVGTAVVAKFIDAGGDWIHSLGS